jgi:beta-lactamase regulating signal transducer with metallopeptidase domain/biopolymer transport protein ExbD
MAALLIYLIKSTICISLFYLVFRWTLKRENLFSLNRILLIAILVLSVAIPLVKMPTLFHQTIKVKAFPDENMFAMPKLDDAAMQITTAAETNSPVSTETNSPISTERNISVEQLSIIVYSAGLLILFSALLIGLVKLFLLLFQTKIYRRKNYRLALVNRTISPMSFGKFIIMSKQDYKEHRNEILKHEQAHIKFKHTYDLLLVELVKLFHWFNPLVYQLRNDLKEIQEFQVDRHMLNSGIDSHKYQLLLIKKCVGAERYTIANSFNHCQIKNRITMMNNQKNRKSNGWKVAIFLPVAALMLMAFGNNRSEIPLNSSIPEITGIAQEKKIWTESDFEKLPPDELNKLTEKGFFQNKTMHNLLMNRNSQMMMDGKKIELNDVGNTMKELFTKAMPSIETNLSVETKSALPFTVCIRKDVGTDANKYSQLLNIVANSFMDAREELSQLKFSKSYNELSNEGRKVIDTMIPINIKIAVPMGMGKETSFIAPPILVEMKETGIYCMNDLVSIDRLKEIITKNIASHPDQIILLKVAPQVKMGEVTAVKEVLREAKALNINYSSDIK